MTIRTLIVMVKSLGSGSEVTWPWSKFWCCCKITVILTQVLEIKIVIAALEHFFF